MSLTGRVNLSLKKTGTTVGERHTSLRQKWHSSAYLKISVSNITLNNPRITYMICTYCQKNAMGTCDKGQLSTWYTTRLEKLIET